MNNNGMDRKITYIVFALITAFFGIQLLQEKDYMSVILFAAVLLAGGVWNLKRKRNPEFEADCYMGMAAVLWTVYNCDLRKETLSLLGHMFRTYRSQLLWLFAVFVIYKVTDMFFKNMLAAIVIKGAVSAAVIQIMINKGGFLTNNAVHGLFGIVLLTFLIAWKRMIIRKKEEYTPLKSLYNLSFVLMFCLVVINVYNVNLVQGLVESPFTSVKIMWMVLAGVLAVAAVRIFANVQDKGSQCFGGNLMLLLLYYVMLRKEMLPWTWIGIALTCLLAGWAAAWLLTEGYLKGKFSLLLLYLYFIPVMVILTESMGHHRYGNMIMIVIAVALFSTIKLWKLGKHSAELYFLAGFIPFFLMLVSKGNADGKNYIWAVLLTILIIGVYAYLYVWGQRTNGTKRLPVVFRQPEKVQKLFFLCCTLIPLLISARNCLNSTVYADFAYTASRGTLAKGTLIKGNVKGSDDIQEVVLTWGNGVTENYHSKLGIFSRVQDNKLTVQAKKSDGSILTFQQYFMLLGKFEDYTWSDTKKPNLKLEKTEEGGVVRLNFVCSDEGSNIGKICILKDGKQAETIANDSESEDKKNWVYTLEYPKEQAYNITAVCVDTAQNYSEPVSDVSEGSKEEP